MDEGREQPGWLWGATSFEWSGPHYKSESQYIPDWPLGTTCWFVTTDVPGRHKVHVADTPQEAVRSACVAILAELDRMDEQE